MKNNTVKGILAATLIVAGSISSFAQQAPGLDRRQVVNDSLSGSFSKKYMSKKQQATAVAAKKGWPLIKKTESSFSELIDVTPDGEPIYITTTNAGSAITSRSNLLYPNGTAGLSLTGKGVLAGIWDGGPSRTDHVTFNGGRAKVRDGSSGTAEHATHVGGTMIGSGGTSTPLARGIAYEGTLNVYDWTNDLGEMASAAADGYMVVSNHSYGLNSNGAPAALLPYYGKYVDQSHDIDEIAYNNPTYQPVVAAGNDRGSNINPTKNGNDLLSQYATAKNTLVVAAIYNVANYVNSSSVTLAPFSSYGPTDDFRIKPDIATKGVNVLSASDASVARFEEMSGTSMASPGISGVVMLLQQHYSNLHPSNSDMPNYMRSATVRGLLAHTADEVGEADGPDHMSGWGLVNAYKSAMIISDQGKSTEILEQNTLASGGNYIYTVTSDGVNPLIATIAWTDPAGTISNNTVDRSTPVLVNDLDLRLVDGAGKSYFPWSLSQNLSRPVARNLVDNAVDNIEKVEIPAPAGTYKLTVSHKKASLSGGSQDYTLIVTGITGRTAGTKDFDQEFFTVWPNPASDILNVNIKSGLVDNTVVSVFDVQGRQVVSKKLASSNEAININHLSSGLYIVKVSQGAKQYVKKVVVK